jgi:predicted ArsR family transcriptional regulator
MRNRKQVSPSSATLLEQLLALVRRSGVRSIGQVAEELGTSPALVETMLEDLARRGYLRPVETQCARACAGCAQACSCAVTAAGRVWQVEPSGGP